MKETHASLKYNKYSLLFLVIWFFLGAVALVVIEKGDLVLYFDNHRSPLLTFVFYTATTLAEPLICIVVCLLFILFNWRKGLFILLAIVLNTVLVQFLKRVVFSDWHRPSVGLEGQLIGIDGFYLNQSFSFPSGHTMAGTTLFLVSSLLIENKWIKLLLVALIPFIALSRVYLAQHYLQDVVMGGTLGLICSMVYYQLYNSTPLRIK